MAKGERNGNYSHGMYKKRIYTTWRNMIRRCHDSSNHAYRYYGARGIRVCDEWHDPRNFLSWAIDSGYNDDLTLDRINSDKGYYAENCRWVTHKQQANNTRRNRKITFNGQTKNLQEWSDITGIHRKTISRRLDRGWKAEDALTVRILKPNEDRGKYANN